MDAGPGSRGGVEEEWVAAPAHGRVLWLAPAGRHRLALLALHGYGQRADDLLGPVRRIAEALRCPAACVEARHHFYRRGGHGDIGASWLTRHGRERMLDDNRAWFAELTAACRHRWRCEHLVLLGFSQGVPQAWRWARQQPRVRHLVAVAGDLPSELVAEPWPDPPRALLLRGAEDRVYDAGHLAADRRRLQELQVHHDEREFPGGHLFDERAADLVARWLAAGP